MLACLYVCVDDKIEDFSTSAPDVIIPPKVVPPNVAFTQDIIKSSSSEVTIHCNFDICKCKRELKLKEKAANQKIRILKDNIYLLVHRKKLAEDKEKITNRDLSPKRNMHISATTKLEREKQVHFDLF